MSNFKESLLFAQIVPVISISVLLNACYQQGILVILMLSACVRLAALCWWVSAVNLYPALFSLVRNLPTPDGTNVFLGHTLRVLSEPSGMPMWDGWTKFRMMA